jgi:hypothetical protein
MQGDQATGEEVTVFRIGSKADFMLSTSVPIRHIRADPCSIQCKLACAGQNKFTNIRANPSHPCRSVFYFGYPKR